ncbi:hypothetical protein [Lysinibacillus xylanilyticus]
MNKRQVICKVVLWDLFTKIGNYGTVKAWRCTKGAWTLMGDIL